MTEGEEAAAEESEVPEAPEEVVVADAEDPFGELEEVGGPDAEEEGEEFEAVAHAEPPKLSTSIGSVKVETQGGPRDESVEDIVSLHRAFVTRTLDRLDEYPGVI